jgi:regulator of sigma E protease
LGHFAVARFFGVKVETFSIGFGNKIYKKIYKGTEYCISAIPLGGYVKMKGQDDLDPTKVSLDNDSYNSKSPLQRIAILLAGPFANFLVAFFIFIFLGLVGVNKLSPTIGHIADNSPAMESTLEIGDKILSINGVEIETWGELSNVIKDSYGSLLLRVQRGNHALNIKITPKISETKSMFGESIKRRLIGIAPDGKQIVTLNYSGFELIGFAFDETINTTKMIFMGIVKLIEGVVSPKEIGGVISIFEITSKASEVGISALLTLTALISVNLGVLNLLPIPALDGGHILFNLYEFITRRKANTDVIYKLTIFGWVILLSLMVLGVYNDLNRIFGE